MSCLQLALFWYVPFALAASAALLGEEEGKGPGFAAYHTSAVAGGYVLGAGLYLTASRRFGRLAVTWGGLATVAAAVLGMILVPPVYSVTLALAGVIGIGGMVAVTGVTVSLTYTHGRVSAPAAITGANAGASVGALLGLLVVGWMVGLGLGWRAGFGIYAFALVLVGLLAFRFHRRAPLAREVTHSSDVFTTGRLPLSYWLAWSMIAVTTTVELMLSLWVPFLLVLGDVSLEEATAAVSAMLFGMLIGRIVAFRLLPHRSSTGVYLGSIGIGVTGIALAALSISQLPGSLPAVFLCLGVGGVGLGPLYSIAMSLALTAAPAVRERAARTTWYGVLLSFGPLALLLEWSPGITTVGHALYLLPLLLLGAGLLALLLRRTARTPLRA